MSWWELLRNLTHNPSEQHFSGTRAAEFSVSGLTSDAKTQPISQQASMHGSKYRTYISARNYWQKSS